MKFFVCGLMVLSGVAAARGDVVRTHPSNAYREEVTLPNWADGGELSRWVYTHPSEVFPAAVVRRDGAPVELTEALRSEIGQLKCKTAKGLDQSLYEAINRGRVDGCIVLHAGKVAFEQYPTIQPNDFHLVFGLSALILTTTAEILEAQGRIDLAKPAASYVKEFRETVWAGAPLRELLGIAIPSVPDSPELDAALGWRPGGKSGGLLGLLAGAKTRTNPASAAEVLALALERATGKSLADLISETIWSRMGAEHDALMVENARGYPLAHAGLATTLRDLARYGLLFTKSAGAEQRSIIPEKTLHRLMGKSEEFTVTGRNGQLLYVNRSRDVVVAYLGTNLTSKELAPPLPTRAIADLF